MINGVTNYLSVSQFASAYGQTPANISALTSYLAGFGIKTDCLRRQRGRVGHRHRGRVRRRAVRDPEPVPRARDSRARGGLSGIPGADTCTATRSRRCCRTGSRTSCWPSSGSRNYGPYASHAAHVEHQPAQAADGQLELLPRDLTGLPNGVQPAVELRRQLRPQRPVHQGCQRVRPDRWPSSPWPRLTRARRSTSGATSRTSRTPAALSPWRTSTAARARRATPAGTGETDLDLEQSGALAPGANVIDYQAPNTDPGFADAFFTAASQNIASTVSASWGESETFLRGGDPGRPGSVDLHGRVRRGLPRDGRAGPVRASTPPVTRERTTPAATSAPPTCRSTPTRTARTSPRRAAPRCPGPAR